MHSDPWKLLTDGDRYRLLYDELHKSSIGVDGGDNFDACLRVLWHIDFDIVETSVIHERNFAALHVLEAKASDARVFTR